MKTLLAILLVMLTAAAAACGSSGAPESRPEDLRQPASLHGAPSAAVDAPVGQTPAPVAAAEREAPDAGAAPADTTDQAHDTSGAEAGMAVRPLRFSDVTMASGLKFVHHPHASELMQLGAGIVVFDFNGDGLDDIFISESVGPNALFRNVGDGTFVDDAQVAGVDDPSGRGNGGCAADYDNDGDQDLFVSNFGQSRLFRNNGDGTFVDVAVLAGIDESDYTYRSTGCAWGDYDQDGYLDLIVVRHLLEFDPMLLVEKNFSAAVGPLVLYRSNGDGTFTDVTTLLGSTFGPAPDGMTPLGNIWGAGFQPGWVDFDNDGDPDLYVVNDMGADVQPNVLWRNDGRSADGAWVFTDVSRATRAGVAMWGMALAVGDYNLDGFPDLFVTNIGTAVLLRNEGGLRFTNTASRVGAAIGMIGLKLRVTWGAVFFDYDNDGDEDLYVVSGYLKGSPNPINPVEQPNVLLRNKGDGEFVDVSAVSGVDDTGIGRGGNYLDVNNDGCLDLVISNYGQEARLFQNACDSGNNWLMIKLRGTVSNRDGIGARITVNTGETSQIREVASGSSQMGQNMLDAHFGLGSASLVDSVTVRWPSGNVQTLARVSVNQRLTITESR